MGSIKLSIYKLTTSAILQKIIQFISIPIIARIYGPETIGIWYSLLSIVIITGTFSLLKFEYFIPVEEKYGDSLILEKLAWNNILFICIPISIGILSLCKIFIFREINIKIYFVIFLILITDSISRIIDSKLTKEAAFGLKAALKVALPISIAIFGILLGLKLPTIFSLAISYLIGKIIQISIGLKRIYKLRINSVRENLIKFIYKNINFLKSIKSNLESNKNLKILFKQGIFTSIGSLFSNLWGAGLPLVISITYGNEEAGQFSFALRLLLVPISSLSYSVGQVFWKVAAAEVNRNPKKVKNLFLKMTKNLLIGGSLIPVYCFFISKFSPFWLGKEWFLASKISLALIPWTTGLIISQPLTHLVAHGKQQYKLFLDISISILCVLIFTVSSLIKVNVLFAILTCSFVVMISYVILYLINLNMLNLAIKNQVKN